jgi:nifR3 family TIM-barrel protein
MQSGFWTQFTKPIFAIAPMANVTDAVFRRMFAEVGRPDVFWTEFVSVEGLLSRGRAKLLPDLWYDEDEHPIVAQIFGGKPEQFEEVGPLIRELGFDGVDVNMGCPDRGVEKSGAGAALIKDPHRAREIIRALKRGVGDLPVSVKTRIGYSRDQIDEWIPALLEEDLAVLTVHLRTRAEMSDVAAHWDLAPRVVALRDRIAPQTLVLGNGDVDTLDVARENIASSGMDGVMVGRGIFGNPWFFTGRTPALREKLERMVRHTELFEARYKSDASRGERIKNFDIMKKHFKAYVTGFDGAKELRIELMGAENAGEVKKIVEKFLAGAAAAHSIPI